MVTSPWLYNATEAVALPGLALCALPSLSNNQTIAAPRSLFWPKAERTWSSAPTAASLLPLPPPPTAAAARNIRHRFCFTCRGAGDELSRLPLSGSKRV